MVIILVFDCHTFVLGYWRRGRKSRWDCCTPWNNA